MTEHKDKLSTPTTEAEAEQKRLDGVHNEQTKLLAGALDRASTACLTIGVIAPVAASYFSIGASTMALPDAIRGTALWFLAAVLIHVMARAVLRTLK